ncbi:MAG: glycosyltransferase family 2 protein [bacterium]|nr:glycosyltransferase family 2 protein [bacterium]
MDLSIIIISYNTAELTKLTIKSIFQSISSDLAFEIIVLDNDSRDNSVPMLKELVKKHDNVILIESKDNLGFSKGNNKAITRANGTHLLFLNSDIIVIDNAIEQLYSFYKTNDEVHFAGGKLLNNNTSPQASTGPFYSLPVVFGALFLKGDYWGLTRYSPNTNRKTDWVSGACLMTTKQLFEELGGFDEELFMYMEEIDLLYRAKKKGYSTYFCAEAKFIHLGSASSQGKTYPILQVYKGFLYFYQKHHSLVAVSLLKGMLQLKADVSIWVGKLTQNRYLIETYGKAKNIITMAR